MGIPLVASFANGIVSQFVNGESINEASFWQHIATIDFAKYDRSTFKLLK